MARYACDGHGARYTGPQRTAYPALVNHALSIRERRRLCEPCFKELREFLVTVADLADEPARSAGCAICSDENATIALFATLYDHGAEREDWYGRLCSQHAVDTAAPALFGPRRHLGGFPGPS